MRLSQPLSVASSTRPMRWRATGHKMRRPSALPSIIPTRSSVLRRLMWWIIPAR